MKSSGVLHRPRDPQEGTPDLQAGALVSPLRRFVTRTNAEFGFRASSLAEMMALALLLGALYECIQWKFCRYLDNLTVMIVTKNAKILNRIGACPRLVLENDILAG